jgi:hypothetical protein
MRIIIAGTITAAAGIAVVTEGRAEGDPPRVPVLIELFTSEGCSSCPPADELLARLAVTQPVAGAEILALGEHVDYWDHLGWRDPFSSRVFSERQSDYDARAFHRGNVYTPQMVVDGREEFTGSDTDAVIAAVKHAIRRPEPRLQITLGLRRGRADKTIAVTPRVTVPPQARFSDDAEVLLAVTQDGLESQVRGGENGGRRLRHSAVARSLRSIGTLRAGDRDWSGTSVLDLSEEGKAGSSRIVVFVQERKSRKIVGAGSAVVTGDPRRP